MITLLHAYGQTTFERESVKAYGSLENLIESDTLAGIPNREKSLSQLWEAANMEISEAPETEEDPQTDETEQEPQEQAETEE